jgi:hypothetical protein
MRTYIELLEAAANDNRPDPAGTDTLVIDLPMMDARGWRRILDRCVDQSLGNLAYREDKRKPLRRCFVVRGDSRIIALLRTHYEERKALSEGQLNEGRRGLAPIGEMRAKVFWNPRHADLLAVLAKSKIGDLRGSWLQTKTETMTAIWPARALGHWNFHNECFHREGIARVTKNDLRIVRDLSVLSEERYWKSSDHYAGDGFFVGFEKSDAINNPDIMALLGRLTPVER